MKEPTLAWWEYLLVAVTCMSMALCAFVLRVFDLDETLLSNPLGAGIYGLVWGLKWIGGTACATVGGLYGFLTVMALRTKEKSF